MTNENEELRKKSNYVHMKEKKQNYYLNGKYYFSLKS